MEIACPCCFITAVSISEIKIKPNEEKKPISGVHFFCQKKKNSKKSARHNVICSNLNFPKFFCHAILNIWWGIDKARRNYCLSLIWSKIGDQHDGKKMSIIKSAKKPRKKNRQEWERRKMAFHNLKWDIKKCLKQQKQVEKKLFIWFNQYQIDKEEDDRKSMGISEYWWLIDCSRKCWP